MRDKFWENYTLDELTNDEWEALCDGCGRCCLIKLQDEETEKVHFTSAACEFLDLGCVSCSVYPQRFQKQPDCLKVTPYLVKHHADWLPDTCAYRLLAENKPLNWWHPLISGNKQTVIDAGISVKPWAVSESDINETELENYVIELLDGEKGENK